MIFARPLRSLRRVFPLVADLEEFLRVACVADESHFGDDLGRPVGVLGRTTTAAEGPALPQQDHAGLEREVLVLTCRVEDVISCQLRFFSICEPAVICYLERGEP